MKRLLTSGIFIFIFALLMGIYVFPWNTYGVTIPLLSNDYKFGLDLQGGIELDYKVDLSDVQDSPDFDNAKESSIIEGLKSVIDKRVQVLNINDSQINDANYGGERHIIVQIPMKGNDSLENSENIERAKEAIGRVVKIEFKEKRTNISVADKEERRGIADSTMTELEKGQLSFSVLENKLHDSYENIDSGILTGSIDSLSNYFSLSKDKLQKGLYSEILTGTGKASLSLDGNSIAEKFSGEGYWILNITDTDIEGKNIALQYIFVSALPSDWIPATDSKNRVLNDKYFLKSSVQYNQAFQPMVELTFNSEGAEIFGELTRRLTGKQIAIFVGGQLLTAPNVNEPILSGKAVITGTYSPEEAKKLSQDINTGVVPAPIYLTSERTIDSRLGADSLNALIYSAIVGFLLIIAFMLFTYRVSGIIATVSLVLYVLCVLVIVKLFAIVLTLASIAGLILSVGMAIDANILIFERIKDELRNGEKMHDALKVGFEKSFSAIWDSNLTGLIVALILFVFGINLIKGFGLMLAIGLVVGLFIFYYISRILVFGVAHIKLKNTCFIGLK